MLDKLSRNSWSRLGVITVFFVACTTVFHRLVHSYLIPFWVVLFFFAFLFLVAFTVNAVLVRRALSNVIQEIVSGSFSTATSLPKVDSDFRPLANEIFQIFRNLSDEKAKTERLSKLAAQMSHDIRSPLAALRMLTAETGDLPEDSRQLMIQIASRIHLIAETLLSEKGSTTGSLESDTCLVYGVVENVASEKRLILPNDTSLEVHVSQGLHGAWVRLGAEGLGRLVSNLLNNSIEAFEANSSISNKRIQISMTPAGRTAIRLSVQDNAGGMSKELEKSILEGSATTTKHNGHGLGLSHATQTVAAHGGRIELFTELGFGTIVNAIIPAASQPSWIAEEINLSDCGTVVVIDDDASIHGVWRARIQNNSLNLVHYKTLAEAEEELNTLSSAPSVLLVDYEFRREKGTGLDLAERFSHCCRFYLVTSHCDNEAIRKRALRMGVKILPKFLAPFIPIVQSELPEIAKTN